MFSIDVIYNATPLNVGLIKRFHTCIYFLYLAIDKIKATFIYDKNGRKNILNTKSNFTFFISKYYIFIRFEL